MKVVVTALVFLCGGLLTSQADTSTVTPTTTTPIPPALTKTSKDEKQQADQDQSSLLTKTAPTEDIFDQDTFNTTPDQAKRKQAQLETEEAAREQAELAKNKNWLFNALEDQKNKDASDPKSTSSNLTPAEHLRQTALQNLSKSPLSKDSPTTASTLTLAPSKDSSNTTNSGSPGENTQNPALLDLQTWKSANPTADNSFTNSKFIPAISGFSTDTTHPLSDEAEKAYNEKVASFKPIAPIEIPSSSSLPSSSLPTIQPITPSVPLLSPNLSIFSTSTAYTPSISTPAIAPLPSSKSDTPLMSTLGFQPIEIPKPPSAPATPQPPAAYKLKVADPNDAFNQ